MQTKKLNQAYKEVDKLVEFLTKRDYLNSSELTDILEAANTEIGHIVNQAISDVLGKLEGSYLEEAQLWAKNEMTNINGEPIKINGAEQRKAQTEMNKISRAIKKLYEIFYC